MWTDVLDLNEFYSSTLGQMTVRLLRARLREVWPNVRGETVLGLGYATPFLRPFREEAERTLAFMPAQQGVTRWPREGRNLTALVDENDLPLPDRSRTGFQTMGYSIHFTGLCPQCQQADNPTTP